MAEWLAALLESAFCWLELSFCGSICSIEVESLQFLILMVNINRWFRNWMFCSYHVSGADRFLFGTALPRSSSIKIFINRQSNGTAPAVGQVVN